LTTDDGREENKLMQRKPQQPLVGVRVSARVKKKVSLKSPDFPFTGIGQRALHISDLVILMIFGFFF